MKLKKILAVALAATTALSSGVAYDMLGASAKTAEAADHGFYGVNETFTVTEGTGDTQVKYTYTVTNPILNGAPEAGNSTEALGTNGTYSDGALKEKVDYKGVKNAISLTTAGTVKLTSIEVGSKVAGRISIPMTISGYNKNTGEISLPGSGEKIATTALVTKNATTKSKEYKGGDEHENDGLFYLTEIELNGDSITNSGNVTGFVISTGNATAIESLKVENFNKLNFIGYEGNDDSAAFINAKTIDISDSDFSLAHAKDLFTDSLKIETLDISNINSTSKSTTTADYNFNTIAATGSYTSINISGNAYINDVVLTTTKNVTMNITDCTGIKNFKITGNADDSYDNPAQTGKVKFITDGGDGSYDLDMSFVSGAKDVIVTKTGIRSFTAPTILLGGDNKPAYTVDASFNALESVNLSSASNAMKVNVSNNKLMDCDISGLSGATDVNVSSNFLTSLDINAVNSGKSFSLNAEKNFIATGDDGTFSRSDDQKSVNITNQRGADAFKWAYAGDIAQASGSTSKALMKLGGTGTLVGGIVVVGAPEGFAKKLADTIKWSEANSADTSAISLGESSVVQATEMAYNLAWPGQGNLAAVIVSTAISANATKTSAEKVTLQYGNTKADINVANDNIIIVDYDITGGLPTDNAENIKNSNKYTVSMASLLFPREGFILNSNGTVDATMSSSAYPLAEVASGKITAASTRVGGSEDKFGELIEEKLKVMEGVTFSKWNTMADGTGTAAAKNAKLKGLAEDTTVYAQYTENTYGVNYNKSYVPTSRVTVTGSTSSQTGLKFGEKVTLTTNGYTTSKGNFYGWIGGEANNDGRLVSGLRDDLQFYSDGQEVQGLAAKSKKTDNYKMNALYGEADHYIATDVTSLDLVVGDAEKGAYKLTDVKAKVTGDPTENNKDAQVGVDLGYGDDFFTFFSSDNDVVKLTTSGYAIAYGAGTANIYVRDNTYGNVATVTVTVQSKEEAAAAAELKAKQAATNKSIAAGEKTDVSDYAKFAAEVVKNADGENTVTVTKGKNIKTAKINTITIGDKTYTVTRIGANAYKGMSKLTTVTTSNKVKVIGKAAFANCKKLTKVTLGKAVVKIGANAFKNDKKLAKIMIKSKKLTKKARVGKNSFKGIKATAKFYIAKKAATYKKVKKAIKAQSGAPKKAKYVKKYA